MKVTIDGIEYAPIANIPEITDKNIQTLLESLTEIQYFYDCSNKHRAWAWDAMNAIAPELAKLSADNPKAAYDRVRIGQSE